MIYQWLRSPAAFPRSLSVSSHPVIGINNLVEFNPLLSHVDHLVSHRIDLTTLLTYKAAEYREYREQRRHAYYARDAWAAKAGEGGPVYRIQQ